VNDLLSVVITVTRPAEPAEICPIQSDVSRQTSMFGQQVNPNFLLVNTGSRPTRNQGMRACRRIDENVLDSATYLHAIW